MPDIKDLLKKSNIARNWSTWPGLIILEATLLSVWAGICNSLDDHVLKVVSPELLQMTHKSFLVSYLIVFLSILIVWSIGRRLPKFGDSEIGILFAPMMDEEAEKVVNEIFAGVQKEVITNKLSKIIKPKRLSARFVIDTVEKACKFRQKSNCHILIWGQFLIDHNINGKKVSGFKQIYFTCRKNRLPPAAEALSNADISAGIVNKTWYAYQENDWYQLEMVSQNIAETVLNILGVSLLLSGRFMEARDVLERVASKFLEILRTPQPAAYFQRRVKQNLALSIAMQAIDIYYTKIYQCIGKLSTNQKRVVLEEMIPLIKLAIKYDSTKGDYYLMLALYFYLIEDYPRAHDAADKAQLHLDNDGAPDLSKGFLYLNEGHFGLARLYYQKSSSKAILEQTILGTIDFIEKIKEHNPDKAVLYFASGFLYTTRVDKQLGISDLKRFVRDAPKDEKIKPLLDFSNHLIEQDKFGM